nr:unnamed protein product [Digitaria exilis]
MRKLYDGGRNGPEKNIFIFFSLSLSPSLFYTPKKPVGANRRASRRPRDTIVSPRIYARVSPHRRPASRDSLAYLTSVRSSSRIRGSSSQEIITGGREGRRRPHLPLRSEERTRPRRRWPCPTGCLMTRRPLHANTSAARPSSFRRVAGVNRLKTPGRSTVAARSRTPGVRDHLLETFVPTSAVYIRGLRALQRHHQGRSGAPPFRDVADAVYGLLNGEPLTLHHVEPPV